MIFKKIVELARQTGQYKTFRQGDANRYPHLNLKLKYESGIDGFVSTDVSHNAEEFLKNDLVIRELMIPSARKLFVKDMLGVSYSQREKLIALQDIANWQQPDYKIETIIPSGLGWNKKIPLNIVRVNSDQIFPIGLMAKGTDIAIVDQNDSTFGQEVAHSIYHFKEGISNGSENITEVHGDPFLVYALQCSEGRLARRVREGKSPHRIKFPDYVCLRAFAGTKIKEGTYHGALGLLSPSMNLAASLVDEQILIDALFTGSSQKLENAVNNYLGEGSYDEIYGSYNVFSRFGAIQRRGGDNAVERMFKKPLFKSKLSQEEIFDIWKNPSKINDELIDRLG
jgi:hypothetical protein